MPQFGLIKDSIDILIRPKKYFSSLRTRGSVGEAIIKIISYYVITCLILGILIILFYNRFQLMPVDVVEGLIFAIPLSIICLLSISMVLMCISSIGKNNSDFKSSMMVTSSVAVLIPLCALLIGLSYIIYPDSDKIINLLFLLTKIYGLYLLYIGATIGLGSKPIIICAIAAFLLFVFILNFIWYA